MQNLKEQIIKSNEAYRKGNPIISDEEYDILLSKLEDKINFIEFESFKKTLMEESGEYKHLYIMGSLNKIRYGENELNKWINKHKVKAIIASEKLDGCSFTARYVDGKFYDGASRGDGVTGTDWTEKLKYILPQTIEAKDTLIIRGELMLCGDSHIKLGYKNQRNGVTGIMGEDAIVPEKLKEVRAFVYDVLNCDYKPLLIFKGLEDLFDVPNFKRIIVKDTIEEDLKEQLELWKSNADYLMDGLVISTDDYINENIYHPEKKIAFKVNSEGYETEVIDIEWNLSSGGLLKPVVLVKPVNIDGVTVSRVSGNNYQWLTDKGIGQTSIIKIIRSGDVIPKIIDVVSRKGRFLPVECPECRTKLIHKGVDLACPNEYCSGVMVKKVAAFLRNCGVEDITEKSLIKFGINTFEDLINWEPDPKYKSETKLYDALDKFVFTKSKMELFTKFVFDGAAEKTITKIYEHWKISNDSHFDFLMNKTFDQMIVECCTHGFPEGIGEKTLAKITGDWMTNKLYVEYFVMDKRYKPEVKEKKTVTESNITGKTFCITGTLTKSRKYFEELIINNGGIISSVSGKLDYLVVGADAGSKLDKAKKLGINILSEEELINLI